MSGVYLIAALAATGLQQRSLWKGGASFLKAIQGFVFSGGRATAPTTTAVGRPEPVAGTG